MEQSVKVDRLKSHVQQFLENKSEVEDFVHILQAKLNEVISDNKSLALEVNQLR